ncbi:hypothetical protein SAMN04487970_1002205 [Paenibacillus tianmuensis]|uniref:Uncharacterized protein n=1 Tax=Paenibacillus tianmuensis TaxID=624147 RepID=A0A1G4PHY2_9BACL|nr:hypothetical protein [Paenibacillus tianmuensis]SCW31765.1 hypothetical protein SAMN04487970_1002205 [Paenibacillus tianmuensis]
MSTENIQALKDIIEGKSSVWWHKWWRDHAVALEKELGRTDYLKLKHGRLTAVSEYLSKIGVSYIWSPKGRLAETYAKLDTSLLDEDGKLNEAALDEHWGGAIGLFKNGQADQSMKIFREMLYKIVESQNIVEFEELANCDILFELGENDFALACLKVISTIQTDDDFSNVLEEFNETYDDIVFSAIDFAKSEYEKRTSLE